MPLFVTSPFHQVSMAPLTPTLDPIPDEEEALSPGSNFTDSFKTLSLDSKPLIQMPQPRHFAPYHTPSSILHSNRSVTPPRIGSSHRLRSTSSTPALTTPMLQRAHSSPIVFPHSPRSPSPLRSPKRMRSPLRHASADEIYTTSSNGGSAISSISEDAEFELPPITRSRHSSSSSLSHIAFNNKTSKPRPHSPMRSIRASSVPASPINKPTRYNEAFVPDLTYTRTYSLTSSSMPSTPTSVRSRSPSISSLETIPDTPDEERLAAEEDSRDKDARRRLWEMIGSSSTPSAMRGTGFAARDKRKRWSVCGAEKRGDLNLETIWED